MALEIEVKFRLSDPEAMRGALARAGAVPAGEVLEYNTYFDTPDAALRQADRGLRIRVEDGGDDHQRVLMTCKGPRRPGPMKIRQEDEVTVDSAASAEAMLETLGFEPTLSFEKRRENFRLGAARICLDELPELGWFIEIEADSEAAVEAARETLGLADEPTVTETYIALVARRLAGRQMNRLTF